MAERGARTEGSRVGGGPCVVGDSVGRDRVVGGRVGEPYGGNRVGRDRVVGDRVGGGLQRAHASQPVRRGAPHHHVLCLAADPATHVHVAICSTRTRGVHVEAHAGVAALARRAATTLRSTCTCTCPVRMACTCTRACAHAHAHMRTSTCAHPDAHIHICASTATCAHGHFTCRYGGRTAILKGTEQRSPFLINSTSDPVSITSPVISWPRTM